MPTAGLDLQECPMPQAVTLATSPLYLQFPLTFFNSRQLSTVADLGSITTARNSDLKQKSKVIRSKNMDLEDEDVWLIKSCLDHGRRGICTHFCHFTSSSMGAANKKVMKRTTLS